MVPTELKHCLDIKINSTLVASIKCKFTQESIMKDRKASTAVFDSFLCLKRCYFSFYGLQLLLLFLFSFSSIKYNATEVSEFLFSRWLMPRSHVFIDSAWWFLSSPVYCLAWKQKIPMVNRYCNVGIFNKLVLKLAELREVPI